MSAGPSPRHPTDVTTDGESLFLGTGVELARYETAVEAKSFGARMNGTVTKTRADETFIIAVAAATVLSSMDEPKAGQALFTVSNSEIKIIGQSNEVVASCCHAMVNGECYDYARNVPFTLKMTLTTSEMYFTATAPEDYHNEATSCELSLSDSLAHSSVDGLYVYIASTWTTEAGAAQFDGLEAYTTVETASHSSRSTRKPTDGTQPDGATQYNLTGGGGVALADDASLDVTGSASVARNLARRGAGGGVLVVDSALSLDDAGSLAENIALVGPGGGTHLRGATATATLAGSARIEGNVAAQGGGGASVIDGAMLSLSGAAILTANCWGDGGA